MGIARVDRVAVLAKVVQAIPSLDWEDTSLVVALAVEAIVEIVLVDSSSFYPLDYNANTQSIEILISMDPWNSNEVKKWLRFGEELGFSVEVS